MRRRPAVRWRDRQQIYPTSTPFRRAIPMRVLETEGPPPEGPPALGPKQVVLVASGDLRPDANRLCWPAQAALEALLEEAFAREGIEVLRGHPVDPLTGHGFISGQRMGLDVFGRIHPDAPIVVAEAVWQYSHHVLPGLRRHRGPILVVANWSGEWPGLVGLLNLTASLTKAGVPYSSIWSIDFTDDFARNGIREWIRTGAIVHDTSHVRDLDPEQLPVDEAALGVELARELMRAPAILGIFESRDEVPVRERRSHRADARPGHRSAEDVHRRGQDCRRVRLRCHWNPVPARPQGPRAGLRSRRGASEQSFAAAGLRREDRPRAAARSGGASLQRSRRGRRRRCRGHQPGVVDHGFRSIGDAPPWALGRLVRRPLRPGVPDFGRGPGLASRGGVRRRDQ